MARSRYSQSELFKKALKLTGGKGVAKRVVPISAKKTGFDTNEGMYADILAQLGGAYSDKLDAEATKRDRDAADEMLEDYLKPQPAWKVEDDGSTPKTLRDAGFNVSMSDALGDQSLEGDEPADQNWMTADESKQFYNDEADRQQKDFDTRNPSGIDALKGSYATPGRQSMIDKLRGNTPADTVGPMTRSMKLALMRDSAGKRESDEARLLAEQDARVKFERGIQKEGRGHANAMELRSLTGAKTPANIEEWKTFRAMDPKDQELYLRMRRGGTNVDLRDRVVGISQVNGRPIYEYYKGTPPANTLDAKGNRIVHIPPTSGANPTYPGSPTRTPVSAPTSTSSTPVSAPTSTVSPALDNVNPGATVTELPETQDQKRDKSDAGKRKQIEFKSRAATQSVMDVALVGAMKALDDSDKDSLSLGASGTLSRIPALLSSSYGGKLRSHIKTLKSPIVMDGIKELRQSSAAGATGFGAMNKEELNILINRLGALDPDSTDPKILRTTLEGVRKQVEIVKADVLENVPHDKLQKLGLGSWIPKQRMPSPAEALAALKARQAKKDAKKGK